MISTDKLSLIFIIISIVVTLVSIGCSIWAYLSAERAKKYKYETQKLRDAFDLEGLFGRFIVESNIFIDNTRSGDWYRGMDVNVVLLPFREVFDSFDSMSHLIGHKEIVLSKIHNIRKIINHYDMATFAERKLVNDLISDVIRFLQREIHFSVRETSEMVR